MSNQSCRLMLIFIKVLLCFYFKTTRACFHVDLILQWVISNNILLSLMVKTNFSQVSFCFDTKMFGLNLEHFHLSFHFKLFKFLLLIKSLQIIRFFSHAHFFLFRNIDIINILNVVHMSLYMSFSLLGLHFLLQCTQL